MKKSLLLAALCAPFALHMGLNATHDKLKDKAHKRNVRADYIPSRYDYIPPRTDYIPSRFIKSLSAQ